MKAPSDLRSVEGRARVPREHKRYSLWGGIGAALF